MPLNDILERGMASLSFNPASGASAPGAAPSSFMPDFMSSVPTHGFERVNDGLKGAWDTVAGVGSGVVDVVSGAVSHPGANPWMMGLGAIFALVLAKRFGQPLVEMFIPGDNIASRGIRGVLSLGLILGSAYLAAGTIGNMVDTPPAKPDVRTSLPATKDPRLLDNKLPQQIQSPQPLPSGTAGPGL